MTKRRTSLYSVHPTVDYARAIIGNLSARTGRSLEEWIRLVKKEGPASTRERQAWLKTRHKLGMTTAKMIADRADGRGAEETDPDIYLATAPRYVDEMYADGRADLRPIHDRLIKGIVKLRPAVRICPCRTMVPVYGTNVVAQIKPTTKTRIDFGLALKGSTRKPPKRLLDTGGLEKGDRITHRIPLTDPADIDDEVWTWFEIACDLDE